MGLMLSLSKYEAGDTSILRQAQDEVMCEDYLPSPQPLTPEERGYCGNAFSYSFVGLAASP